MARSKDASESKTTKMTARSRTVKTPKAAVATAPEITGVKKATRKPAKASAGVPSTAAIQQRAYELFVERGSEHGHDVEDWVEAERQLRGE